RGGSSACFRLEKLLRIVARLHGTAARVSRQKSRSLQTFVADNLRRKTRTPAADPARNVRRQRAGSGFGPAYRKAHTARQNRVFRGDALSFGKSRLHAARKLDGRIRTHFGFLRKASKMSLR